ncbi:unnamed protein product [Musa textilis]
MQSLTIAESKKVVISGLTSLNRELFHIAQQHPDTERHHHRPGPQTQHRRHPHPEIERRGRDRHQHRDRRRLQIHGRRIHQRLDREGRLRPRMLLSFPRLAPVTRGGDGP